MFSAKDIFQTKAKSGYTIAKSLRFRSSASAYLSRTPGTAGNRKTWTWSGWVKRGQLGARQDIFATYVASTDTQAFYISFTAGDLLNILSYTVDYRITTQVFRDPSAWYHIVVALDSTNATAANRLKLYVNGSEITAFTTNNAIVLNQDYGINQASLHTLGMSQAAGPANGRFCDCYLTEVNFIDGQALDPTYFGQTDTATGVWMPKKYTGTYGTNGFYLNFSDASGATATTIGKDSSGNGNNWTPTNISVTAGVTYDSMVDTPTNYDNGGNGAGNYATFNPLATVTNPPTLSNGNLTTVTGTTGAGYSLSTIALPASGKYYLEAVASNTAGGLLYGVAPYSVGMNGFTGTACGYYSDGTKFVNGVNSAYGSAFTTNTIGFAIDVDGGTITFYRDNVSQGAITYAAGSLFPFVSDGSSGTSSTIDVNFGQRPFTYTPPSGFKALCTQNLPTPTIGATSSTLANKYFDINVYTGNGATSRSFSGFGFAPDFIWHKDRTTAYNHRLYDVLRGTRKTIYSNLTNAEIDEWSTYGAVNSFDTTGYTITTGGTAGNFIENINSEAHVAWLWKANGTGSSNTSGSITSTVSANVTAGFSVVTWTGQPISAGASTIGHGLGVVPKLIIIKNRNVVDGWYCYNAVLGNGAYIVLNSAAAQVTGSALWNSTSPTSTVFTLRNNSLNTATTDNLVAYCFAEVAGYSKFGSYTGNGSADGVFVYTGFRPRYLLVKGSSAVEGWVVWDTARNTYNAAPNVLYPNGSNAETSTTSLDILSNGFKMRNAATNGNISGVTYVYAAFAESPFNYSRAF